MTLDELKAITDKATPGPWAAEGHRVSDESGACVAAYSNVYPECACEIEESDAAFIAAARNAMPVLLKIAEVAKFYCDNTHPSVEDVMGIAPLKEALKKLDEIK